MRYRWRISKLLIVAILPLTVIGADDLFVGQKQGTVAKDDSDREQRPNQQRHFIYPYNLPPSPPKSQHSMMMMRHSGDNKRSKHPIAPTYPTFLRPPAAPSMHSNAKRHKSGKSSSHKMSGKGMRKHTSKSNRQFYLNYGKSTRMRMMSMKDREKSKGMMRMKSKGKGKRSRIGKGRGKGRGKGKEKGAGKGNDRRKGKGKGEGRRKGKGKGIGKGISVATFPPTSGPTLAPSSVPSSVPSSSLHPSNVPSLISSLSVMPSQIPSSSLFPSGFPSSSMVPSSLPSSSSLPSGSPSTATGASEVTVPVSSPGVPQAQPTNLPTMNPSAHPSKLPSGSPSSTPSEWPSAIPTDNPDPIVITNEPTETTPPPSIQPKPPTFPPSVISRTEWPSAVPTEKENDSSAIETGPERSISPRLVPTVQPSASLSKYRSTLVPTAQPSASPAKYRSTLVPSAQPSASLSKYPSTLVPSAQPSASLAKHPSATPSKTPSQWPSAEPSKTPSQWPSALPTEQFDTDAFEMQQTAKSPAIKNMMLQSVPVSRPFFLVIDEGEDRTIADFDIANGNFEASGYSFVYVEDRRRPNGDSRKRQFVQRFRLETIPENAKIVSASLRINGARTGDPIQINMHRLLVPWDQETADGDYFASGIGNTNSIPLVQADGSEASSIASASFRGDDQVQLDLDVTKDVQFWAANPNQNYGWVFLPKEGERGRWSMWSFNSALKPVLTIEYKL